jgi:hypothetical protein
MWVSNYGAVNMLVKATRSKLVQFLRRSFAASAKEDPVSMYWYIYLRINRSKIHIGKHVITYT